MPIHLRAEPGDYAPAVLCPGDPRRAEYIAETFFDRRPSGQRGAGHARLHRHVRGPPALRAVHRHGMPERGDRLRGAHPARRPAADPGGHVRGAPAGHADGRHRRRRRPRRPRTARSSPTPTASRTRRRRRGPWSSGASAWPGSGARPCTSGPSCRAPSSTTPTPAAPAVEAAGPPRRGDGSRRPLHDRRHPRRGGADAS